MARKSKKTPLELPEFLAPDQMEQFMNDPNYRHERRKARLAKLAPVAGQLALRGRTRDWLHQRAEPAPKPDLLETRLVRILLAKTKRTKPLTDGITAWYDILPNTTSASEYGGLRQREFEQRIREEETDPRRIEILNQGAIRKREHTKDNLQFNLWLKTNIARLRLAYTDSVLDAMENGKPIDTEAARQTGLAIADFGFCLRFSTGLLKNIGEDVGLAYTIEATGEYIADGHPEALFDNYDLIQLSRQEQEKRAIYWGERYNVAEKALGLRLPDEELVMENDIDRLTIALYSQLSENYQVA